uniref:Uncharacterized protein n=1 Tax=Anguilla anguilla TaxID=7936 RepID=A0A0E9TK21_ANGAN
MESLFQHYCYSRGGIAPHLLHLYLWKWEQQFSPALRPCWSPQ